MAVEKKRIGKNNLGYLELKNSKFEQPRCGMHFSASSACQAHYTSGKIEKKTFTDSFSASRKQ